MTTKAETGEAVSRAEQLEVVAYRAKRLVDAPQDGTPAARRTRATRMAALRSALAALEAWHG